MEKTNITKSPVNKQFTMERVFDAPIGAVWSAWTDSDKLAKWWGPRGWETTNKAFEFKPGGTWHYCMKCVDENQGEFFGQESWGKTVYESINEPNEIVYRDYFSDAEGTFKEEMPGSITTLRFIEEDGKTRVVSETIFDTLEGFEQVVAMGMEQGAAETWDRLAEYLEK